jgi:hypothetical protein
MRKYIVAFIFAASIACIARAGFCDNLDGVRSSAGDLYNSAKRVSTSSDVGDARSRSRDTVSDAIETRNAAMDAGAYDAAGDASDALGYASKAANAHSLDDARFYAKQAEQAATNAQVSMGSSRKSVTGSAGSGSGIASINDYLDEPSQDSGSDY